MPVGWERPRLLNYQRIEMARALLAWKLLFGWPWTYRALIRLAADAGVGLWPAL